MSSSPAAATTQDGSVGVVPEVHQEHEEQHVEQQQQQYQVGTTSTVLQQQLQLQLQQLPPTNNNFWLDLFSKTLFMVASFCYVGVAAVGLNHPLRGTKYMWISLFAAFLFAVVGVIDLVILPRIMGAIMILAGVFGILSVAVANVNVNTNTNNDLTASKALNCVSVHLFFVEAVVQFVMHRTETGKMLRFCLRSGDMFWVCGSLTDVILSYVSIRGTYADSESGAAMFSACLWLASSLVYVVAVIYVRVVGGGSSSSSSNTNNVIADLEMKVERGNDTIDESNDNVMAPESKIV